jgi:hypothetical protein
MLRSFTLSKEAAAAAIGSPANSFLSGKNMSKEEILKPSTFGCAQGLIAIAPLMKREPAIATDQSQARKFLVRKKNSQDSGA